MLGVSLSDTPSLGDDEASQHSLYQTNRFTYSYYGEKKEEEKRKKKGEEKRKTKEKEKKERKGEKKGNEDR